MYWFGKKIERSDRGWLEDAAWSDIFQKRMALAKIPSQTIIGFLDAFSQIWCDPKNFEVAVEGLKLEAQFSEAEIRNTLNLLPGLLSRESLEKRIKAEFTKSEVLDSFTKLPHFSGKVRAVPQGLLLHVTAGNVFLSSIDSLIMGFLTKNVSIVKVSSQNIFFPQFFAQKLFEFDRERILSDKFAILNWKGGDVVAETFLKKKVNAIIAWGGEDMIESYSRNLPRGVKFLDFGPKISLQIISKDGLKNKNIKEVASRIVQDILPWNQGACASPQDLYIQEGFNHDELLKEIDLALGLAPSRGPISDDEATEVLKEYYRGLYSELMEDGKVIMGKEHLLHLESNKFIRPSPLNRSLVIKKFLDASDLVHHLEPFSYYLQSCSYLLSEEEKKSYIDSLSLVGIKRFAPIGTITFGMEGAPHDGRFVLRELVTFVGDEVRVGVSEDSLMTQNSQSLKTHFDNSKHPPGYVFSSGGTTGEPKFVHFSYEEFDFMTDMLAQNLSAQGIKAGMMVANLFVAGNLWSSFMAVEKALEKIGVIQLPIGGLCSVENITSYLKKFKPDVVMGIPSLLVSYAESMVNAGDSLEVSHVFYAGEALSASRQEFISQVWKTKHFGSAGYASVDAGVIGYQCTHCGPGEHHLFSDGVELKILDEEAVVTSLYRNTMPIINYRTGDKVEWISDCACGRIDKRFKLLGRIDNVLQVWSCRLLVDDIERALRELDSDILTYQITIREQREANLLREKMTISYEKSGDALDSEDLLRTIYEFSRDLKDTIALDEFRKEIEFEILSPGMIPRNARTGKISTVRDLRK